MSLRSKPLERTVLVRATRLLCQGLSARGRREAFMPFRFAPKWGRTLSRDLGKMLLAISFHHKLRNRQQGALDLRIWKRANGIASSGRMRRRFIMRVLN